jgi:hypothetical protein
MGLNPESRARFNLQRASVLVLEETPLGMSILVQILTGFGAKILHRCESVAEAETCRLRWEKPRNPTSSRT